MDILKKFWWVGVIVVFIGFLVGIKHLQTSQPGQLDGFASCLKDKGVTFFGAFWCPHCQAQKKLFGASVKLLPYVECSTPDSQGQTQICKDKGITGYPVWEFKDGSRLSGEQTLQTLADKSSCTLPPQS